ncbi:MarR family transcriptional regulator [Roseibium sp.]|uniref:MarR family winged helix-turn-helix transcriptional regulator n=1 Tax=Roseibium sp. TaxID=1936156 RepID=UPI003299DF89
MDKIPDTVNRSQHRGTVITDDDRILYLLNEISRGARKAYDARIARIGLNQTQWRIIGQLLRDPVLTQAEIAKKLELESATIGQAVAGLCARGLMERVRAQTDRRAWQLILTEQLDDLLPELRGSADRLHDLLWRDIATDEKRTLRDILAKLSANLEQQRNEAD